MGSDAINLPTRTDLESKVHMKSGNRKWKFLKFEFTKKTNRCPGNVGINKGERKVGEKLGGNFKNF